MDFDPPPSASGDVAPELFLEGPSTDEAEAETEAEAEGQFRDETELVPPRKLRTRGGSGVPEERKEPRTHEAKALIIPDGLE